MGGLTSGSGHDAVVVQCLGVAVLDREMISWWLLAAVLLAVAVLCWWELR